MPDQRTSDAEPSRAAELMRRLAAGTEQLKLPVEAAALKGLIDYILLLERWNRTWNLTAVRDAESMLDRHLLDSLSVVPFLYGNRFLDVGTGAGLPGIPLALTLPTAQVYMVDSNAKKTRFVQQAIASLRLPNASVEQARVEQLQQLRVEEVLGGSVDTLVSRAFSAPLDIISRCRHLCVPGSRILFMLGALEQQFDTLPDDIELENIHRVSVTQNGTQSGHERAAPLVTAVNNSEPAGKPAGEPETPQRHIAVCRIH